MIFLVQYDRSLGNLVRFDSFSDEQRGEAEQVRLELELAQLGQDAEEEIVLFEAESEEALRRTHGRYFETLDGLVVAAGELEATS